MPAVVDRVRLISSGFWCHRERPRASYAHLVIHSLEGYEEGAIAHWNRGAAGAHLIVKRSGETVLCCPLELVAWHAGTDARTGRVSRGVDFRSYNINAHAVGLELEGFAFDGRGFTDAQLAAVVRFAAWYRDVLGWPADAAHTWRHSEISTQRGDPGPHFPMAAVLERIAATPRRWR